MPYTQILAEAPTPALAPGTEERRSRRKLIELLAAQGTSAEPIQHWTQGLARLAQAGLSGYEENKLRKEERDQQARLAALLAGVPISGSEGASADVQDPATARAPDGMDRGISSGSRSAAFGPVTTEPPAAPTPQQLNPGMVPTNSQDTFRTPLDMMAPRAQGLAALGTAMGAPPPMTGATPAGATPVQTQAIRPPAPAPAAPTSAPMASGVDPKMGAYIKSLIGSGDPGAQKFGMQLLLAEQQRAEARATRAAAEKPTFGKIGVDPATGTDVMGWIDPRRQTTTPAQVPGGQQPAAGEGAIPPPPPGADPKKWREKQTEMLIARQAGQPQKERAANIVIGDIDRAIKIATDSPKSTTGVGGQLLQNFGGTEARNLSALVDTIKANASFDRLQQMREASPTGAALGAVSDTELRLLGSAIGALDQSQTQEQFIQNLQRVRSIYSDVINGPGKTPTMTSPPAGAPDKAALKKKYGLE